MSRARGQRAPTLIEEQGPFHVAVLIPCGTNLVLHDAGKLSAFVGTYVGRGRSKRDSIGETVKFCFGSEAAATDFARRLQAAGVSAILV